jgi:NitT/TauT family transport system ATP-binding protein
MAQAGLEIANLRVTYPMDGAGRVAAIEQVDLSLRASDFVALIGPSGCGKSTLFNVIAGLQIPDWESCGSTATTSSGKRARSPT